MNDQLSSKFLLYTRIALVNFFIAASLGLALRYAFVHEINIKYKNVMHAHSHVAMLGWIYLMFTILLWRAFGQEISGRVFAGQFWITEFSVLGMLFSFPFEGYGLFSISFSTLFILLTYFFSFRIWKSLSSKSGHDILLAKTSLIWLLVSTLGIWAMAPIMAGGAKGSAMYYIAIQFFLHFQFNGWFTFACLALFFHTLRNAGIIYEKRDFKFFFYLLVISCVLTFALAVSWADPEDFLFVLNSAGVVIQLAAVLFFLRIVWQVKYNVAQGTDSFPLLHYRIALFSLIIRIIIQSVLVIPQVAVISYTIRLYVLGFIHLIMLGTITTFLLGYAFSSGMLSYKNILAKAGWILLIAGLVFSELILFGQGSLLWAGLGYISNYYLIIFLASAFLPVGILLALFGQQGHQVSPQPPSKISFNK